jgi:tetratricopeptide (TPR) repeat protein
MNINAICQRHPQLENFLLQLPTLTRRHWKSLSVPELKALAYIIGYEQPTRWHQSLPIWNELLKRVPDSSALWNDLGVLYAKNNRRRQSLKCYVSGLKIDPNDGAILENIGYHYQKIGEFDMAMKMYQQGANVGDIGCICKLAELYINQGQVTRALALLKPYEHHPDALKVLAKLAEKDQNWEKAIEIYQELTINDPTQAFNYHQQIGFHAATLNDFDLAKYHYTRSLDLQPTSAITWYNLAMLYRSQSASHPKINTCLSMAYAIDPTDADVLSIWADWHRATNQPLKAMELISLALQLDSNDAFNWSVFIHCVDTMASIGHPSLNVWKQVHQY